MKDAESRSNIDNSSSVVASSSHSSSSSIVDIDLNLTEATTAKEKTKFGHWQVGVQHNLTEFLVH